MSDFIKRWCKKYGPLPDGATHYRECAYASNAILKVCSDRVYFWSRLNKRWIMSTVSLFEDSINPIEDE